MIIKEVLASTIAYFKKHNIPEPRLDAEVLLADLLNMERIGLYVNFDLPLKEEELEAYRRLIFKRAHRTPVAYLTGHKEFMSLDFKLNKDVLIPRPETELLVEEVIDFCREEGITQPNIVDLGTGSGAIAVSLAYYLSEARLIGIDISKKALKLARFNVERYNLSNRVKLIQGDLLEPILKLQRGKVDILVSNPPYISEKGMKKLPPEVQQEPRISLYGGQEGLVFYEQIIPQARQVLRQGGLLALEIGFDQAIAIKGILATDWQKIEVKNDYAGHNRVILAIKP